MSFIYPFTIQITRPGTKSGVGAVSYGGADPTTETPVASDVPASIQLKKDIQKPDGNLPADIAKRSMWKIFFILPQGTVNDRDVITDDVGQRYQVTANYWNSLGYAVLAEKLEA